jgi:3-oxoacyl-[acyl-carrier-protein] synthase-3
VGKPRRRCYPAAIFSVGDRGLEGNAAGDKVASPRTKEQRVGAVVIGTGHYAPLQVRGNDEVARACGTDDAWITARTGIRERRIASGTENAGTLAYEASRLALSDAGIDAEQLDMIVVCTVTPEMAVPSTACLLQDRLGVGSQGMPSFDLAAGCSGFLYGLATAHAHMQFSGMRHVLLVGVDVLSRMTDRSDRQTAMLLGDGAGAVVLRRSEGTSRGVLHTGIGADGSGHGLLYAPGPFNQEHLPGQGPAPSDYYLRMDGPRVFKVAVNRMRQQVEAAVAACAMPVAAIDMVIAHQANRRLLDAVAEKLQLPAEKVYANIDRYGNTSAASIPMAYDEARREGRVRHDDVVVMVVFGAGLTWGSAVIREGA